MSGRERSLVPPSDPQTSCIRGDARRGIVTPGPGLTPEEEEVWNLLKGCHL